MRCLWSPHRARSGSQRCYESWLGGQSTREGRCSWLQPVSAASTAWPPGARDAGNGYLAPLWTIPKLVWHLGVAVVEGGGRGGRKGESLMLGSWASGGYS
jgi:hypothetical protein